MAKFRSGFIALVGRPNVGKSTLLNRLVGEKIAIATPVAQTTRHRIKGVVTLDKGQLIFLDTPGFSKPLDSLGKYLCDEASAALADADAIAVVVDASQAPGKGDAWVCEQALKAGKPILLLLNKSDLLKGSEEQRAARRAAYLRLFADRPDSVDALMVSAHTGKRTDRIADRLLRWMPEGPRYYDADALTDQRLREMAAETIREKALLLTRDEIPHSVAVCLDRFEETADITRIDATLVVDQTSQKGILIGAGGSMIKAIGAAARQDLESLMDGPVFVGLTVKVRKNWRKDPKFLQSLGLAPPQGQ
ncbi:MAG: GTPase Era [Vampirovibrionales bacterium]|nr:GTPase Era [Vampirovibrionales bacterium]